MWNGKKETAKHSAIDSGVHRTLQAYILYTWANGFSSLFAYTVMVPI